MISASAQATIFFVKELRPNFPSGYHYHLSNEIIVVLKPFSEPREKIFNQQEKRIRQIIRRLIRFHVRSNRIPAGIYRKILNSSELKS